MSQSLQSLRGGLQAWALDTRLHRPTTVPGRGPEQEVFKMTKPETALESLG